tara:strand:- start:36 stop:803 length:768 start_codon:yes stop_codon:yes gene_type:complete
MNNPFSTENPVAPKRTSRSKFSFSKLLMIAVILIVLYLIYKYYKSNKKDKTLVKSHNAKQMKMINGGSLPKNRNTDYTFSIWYYVDDWNYKFGEPKIIFGRMDSDNSPAPSVLFAPNNNNIHVTLAVYPNKKSTQSNTYTCKLENVPLQKWTNLIITTENRALDIYLDGKLVKTCVMPGVPKVANASNILLTPNGGFSGYTNSFKYFSYSVNPKQAYDIYKSGLRPNLGSLGIFDKYKFKMSFLKDNHEVKSVEI